MFMDFTTQELEMNEPPMWTSVAPENGTIVPTPGGERGGLQRRNRQQLGFG